MIAVLEAWWHADGGVLPAVTILFVCLVLAPVAGAVAEARSRQARERAAAMRLHPSSPHRQTGAV